MKKISTEVAFDSCGRDRLGKGMKKLPGVMLRVGGKVNTAIQVLILLSDDKDLEVGRLSPLSREKGEIAIAYLER